MTDEFIKRLDRLEELADKANPLKWQNNFDGIMCSNLLLAIGEHSQAHLLGKIIDSDNAEYIAAANPAMIKEMIAEMRKMWRQNNWDVAALQAYGALPEDMEVSIENESFAWHLNRIKTGIGKRLKFTEKRLEDCLQENERLEQEADWLAETFAANMKIQGQRDGLRDPAGGHKEFWREAARKAVAEAGNA